MSILPPRDLLSLRRADVVTNLEDKMDGFKSATGLSNSSTDDSSQNDSFQKSKSQSGEEPLSGVKGQGTVEEPYDAGNQEGNEGAPAKQGVSGVLSDTKRKAEELVGKRS